MSIYITNMDIPKDEAVALYIYPDGRVKLWRPQAVVSHEYEAVPIPPHGRCIDVDALIKELTLDDEDDKTGATLLMAIFLEVLKAAPTIIPAEEGE